jgi:hypothetical protein
MTRRVMLLMVALIAVSCRIGPPPTDQAGQAAAIQTVTLAVTGMV